MSSSTTNLHLVKPALSEAASITVINDNMDLIDAAVGALQTSTEDLVTLTRTFYASSSSISCACTTNQKTFLLWTAASSAGTSGGMMDSTYGGLFVVSNGQYAVIHKGSAISCSLSSGTFTVSSTSSVAMGIVEL